MNTPLTTATLKVTGASLHYEVRGSGPLLVIIPGGPQDAGVFAELAERLADRYRVVAFDLRGNSRSSFDGPAVDLDVDVHADDVARLIEELGGGSAYIFGTSGGAQIGLNLAARHPGKVKVLVAHEPPSVMMLDDPSEALAADRALHETYRREGVDAAMAAFFAMSGLDDGNAQDGPPPFDIRPEAAETFERVSGNFEYWLAHGLLPLSLYEPDVEALKAGAPKVVVALGEASVGQPIHEMGSALARMLGIDPVPFPGDHMGFEQDARAFADQLHRSFAAQ
ncbi:alpha/beta hydrolase [Nitratireductor mangrovi]|uniref:Alpha/beta hydrolase n=1 Tax=Nitratireductor mangrovi TaxID=2599600 RepID=A0A5B8L214_9HYPH|nr:alpha/beta hydrolase [Nitratireductor mangrovi]QDZ01995.1 alpha/beta hydrolase [Nitratireductor mangrovi]